MSCGNCSGGCQSRSRREPRFPFYLLKSGKKRFFASLEDAVELIAWADGQVEICYDTEYNVLQSDLTLRPITDDEKKQMSDKVKKQGGK